jgi:aspartyl-tRNA(Asn)/glutamyl-tRNA(Gln) amidotransferase subunit B
MYTPTIGLEVHAELKTKSKMFCGCPNEPHASVPNTNICPVCLAHPGTLPVANEAAVKNVITFGTAVGGEIATYAEFDRKNYFYPDIPKAYQISQYAFPFVKGGELAGVALTRVHLEEDTARSQHDKGDDSLVDFNRAGVPLMELVTEPVIHDAKTAGNFARELQLVLRALGISDANMEKGEMRVEANVSVSNTGERAKKYVEIKNLNSFKSVESAIAFEIERQISVIESGQSIEQETRGWDEVQGKTFTQRSKETAKDYRYFPDPDLPKLNTSKYPALLISREDEIFNKIPAKRRVLLASLGITEATAEIIIQSAFLSEYVEALLGLGLASDVKKTTLAVNYLLTDLAPLVITASEAQLVLSPVHFLAIISALADGKFTTRIAKDIIIALAVADADPLEYARTNNLVVEVSAEMIQALVQKVITENEAVVAEYKAGKTTALQYLLGQAMKQSRGTIAPNLISETLIAAIG